MGKTVPLETQAILGNARADFPYTSEERNIGGATEYSRIYSKQFLVCMASGGKLPVIELKQFNTPPQCTSLSHDHYELSAEYHKRERLY